MQVFKNINMKRRASIAAISGIILLTAAGCAKLKETPYGSVSVDNGGASSPSDLNGVYSQLFGQTDQANTYALQEHPTDEMMGPTRGTDWDDFGTWRKLHLHTWDASHNQINDTWNGLNGALFQTTLLAESTSASQADVAAARFLRAYFSYVVCDLYGQVQHRRGGTGAWRQGREQQDPAAVAADLSEHRLQQVPVLPADGVLVNVLLLGDETIPMIIVNRPVLVESRRALQSFSAQTT